MAGHTCRNLPVLTSTVPAVAVKQRKSLFHISILFVFYLFYLLGVTFHHDGVRVVQLGPVVLDEVEEGSGVTAAAVGVVAQPQPQVGPVDQKFKIVDVGLLELRDPVPVQVELLQVPGQTVVLENTDLVSGEEELRNFLVELGTLVSAVVSVHGVGEITYLVV